MIWRIGITRNIQDYRLHKRRTGKIYDEKCPNVRGKTIPVPRIIKM